MFCRKVRDLKLPLEVDEWCLWFGGKCCFHFGGNRHPTLMLLRRYREEQVERVKAVLRLEDVKISSTHSSRNNQNTMRAGKNCNCGKLRNSADDQSSHSFACLVKIHGGN